MALERAALGAQLGEGAGGKSGGGAWPFYLQDWAKSTPGQQYKENHEALRVEVKQSSLRIQVIMAPWVGFGCRKDVVGAHHQARELAVPQAPAQMGRLP